MLSYVGKVSLVFLKVIDNVFNCIQTEPFPSKPNSDRESWIEHGSRSSGLPVSK